MSNNRPSIAIVGVSALFPGSTDAGGFWTDILAGVDLVEEIPKSHWLKDDYMHPELNTQDMTYATRGAFIESVPFDALSWGVPPKIVPATDSAQLLALIMAQRVLNDATQGQFKEMDKSRTSVILGVTSAQELLGTMVSRLQHPVWRKALRDSGLPESKVEEAVKRISDHYVPWQESTFPGLLGNVVAGRIANRLDLGGTNCVTDAACASAFAAVSMAVNELYLGQSDLVITGGVDTMNDIFMYMCFAQTTALSRSGDVKPFSDQADGTLLGEGLGMVALKRLEDAERDGDRIYGLIQGVGSSSDGRSKSVYAPVASGQAKALNRAYGEAGFSPKTVELVEAHGTGTPAGDYAEFQGLCLAFEEEDAPRQWCALGSVKSQIGHAKAAAGAAGLFKSVMALHHKVLPPTIKVERPNPKMNLDETPFYLNLRARPWVRGSNHPRRAGVSSFGFGGSNFHIAVEEYSGTVQATRHRVASHELFVMGADSAEALVSALKSVEIPAEMHRRKGLLAWLAKDSQLNLKTAASHRVAIVASDLQELSVKLGEAASLIQSKGKAFSTPKGIHYGMGEKQGQTAFLFPGQGSQYLDMGAELAMTYPQALAAWDEAADVHMDETLALHQVVFPPSVFGQEAKDAQLATLTSTQWAQPAIGACSLSQLRLLQAIGVHADAVAGHSYGEVTALHAAGVFDAATMLRVARKRGELMNEAASIPGSMTAVAAEIEKVKAALDGKDIAVVLANHNSPRQVVLSGRTEAIEQAEKVLADAELTCQRLKVATAFHSEVVSASVAPFAEFLEGVEFSTPEVSVYANSEAAPYPSDAASMRKVLSGQIASPVRFVEQIEAMYEQGVRTFIEVGPHSVLSGLGGRILKSKKDAKFVYLNRRGKPGLASFNDGLAQLVAAGFAPSFSALWDGFRVEADPRENVLPKFAIDVNGTNVGKPYPPPGGTADLPGPNPEVQPEVIVQEVEVIREVEVIKEVEVVREVAVAAAPSIQMAQGVTPAPHIPGGSLGVQAAAPVNQGVLGAFQEAQRQTMEAHAGWQKAMADTHMAFLQGVEQSFVGLNALMGVQGVAQMAPAQLPVQPVVAAPMPAPVQQAAPAPAPVQSQPVAALVAAAPVAAPVAAKPSALDQLLSPAAAPAVKAAPVVQASSAVSVDLNALMLKVVADKTGYPAEMLTLAMDLEADLGIDSIKRVEILSAMREEAPSLPEVDAGEMSALRTLGEIVEYMAQAGGVSNVAAAPAVSAGPSVDLNALMLKVVADKTGYPAEMLTLGMDLEADLGIDSIKRVEILSAMREEAPSLPEVDAGEMSALRTLGEIVEYMAQAGGVSNVAAAPAVSAGPSVDLNALMLKVVADKTGYPAEMLTLGMDLEADLGIDSIKRVEILSAMREEAPSLPEVDAGEMSALRTLGEIVEYMGKSNGESVSAPAPAPIPSAPGVSRYVLDAVATKAGGLTLPGLDGDILVVPDDSGVAEALVTELKGAGLSVKLGEAVGNERAVIFLAGLSDADGDAADRIAMRAFQAARVVANDCAAFVTVQDTGGDFGLSGTGNPWMGGLAGLAKTAAIEWPNAGVKAIDLQRGGRTPKELAKALSLELLAGGTEREVGLRADGVRLILKSVEAQVEGGEASVDSDSVMLVSGGARGVTAATVISLGAATQASFVLLGRTALGEEPAAVAGVEDDAGMKRALLMQAQAKGEKVNPAGLGKQVRQIMAWREIRSTLAQLAQHGCKARYASVDVTDAAALKALVVEVEASYGPVTGVIHGAGVLADKAIADKTDDQFERVYSTKVNGLRALQLATADSPLRLWVQFSSVAARAGNNGQCDYAMANEVLNKVAGQMAVERPELRVKSMNWGPWEGGMVTPALKARFQAMGVPLIPLAQGAQMLVDEVQDSAPSRVELVLGGEPTTEALLDSGKA